MKEAKLFQNGQSQAVRLPKQFRLPGKSVYIKKQGACVILIPKQNSWKDLFEATDEFSDDFRKALSARDQGELEQREKLF